MARVHDMGGRTRYFGPLPPIDPDEPVFHEVWEARTFALALLANRVSGANLHAFRHAIERVPEEEYLSGYYQRWLASAELLLLDSGILAPGAVEARARRLQGEEVGEPPVPEPHKPGMPSGGPGNLRTVEAAPAFAVGDPVTARADEPAPHTRLPGYARGRTGTVVALRPAQVFPDTAAQFTGENPQHVYEVRFDARELWGADAEPGSVTVDLYESYLERAR
ncbi:nitrile hydratase subunit beta [Geodermatophilus ruber]|uniref:Nitrile hydratase subunit beta n=1 Tax=Geodermatophilus ruber TaxID=504800 RepID=A0A1I4F8A1_9ACTN|nr:nitrile hydratase subunit beta [Geodermatophilus ruber]SFL13759.1 nitrile hydratase [Geodermatophilus ruber]